MSDNRHEQPGLEQDAVTGRDAVLLATVRQQLDQSCAALDGHTLSRLHSMRVAAVSKRRSRLSAWVMPFGGLVTACALVVAVNVGWNIRNADTSAPAAMEDMEILAGNEALDLYADYEFYQWLAQD
jgi:hypothetical protein